MDIRADSVTAAYPLFHEEGGGSIPTSALQLLVETIPFQQAKVLNAMWHSRLPRMGTGCISNQPYLCFGAAFDGLYYAVAIWSNPVARNLPQSEWMELRRLAIAPAAPKNTASRMLGVMRKWIRSNRPAVTRLISYQDMDVHSGTIYKAAGWVSTAINTCGVWNRPNRSRPKSQSESPKRRWEIAT